MRRHAECSSGHCRRVVMDSIGGVFQDLRASRSVYAMCTYRGHGSSQRRNYRLWASHRMPSRYLMISHPRFLYRQGPRPTAAPITGSWGRRCSQDTYPSYYRVVSPWRFSGSDNVRGQMNLLRCVSGRRKRNRVRGGQRKDALHRFFDDDYRGYSAWAVLKSGSERGSKGLFQWTCASDGGVTVGLRYLVTVFLLDLVRLFSFFSLFLCSHVCSDSDHRIRSIAHEAFRINRISQFIRARLSQTSHFTSTRYIRRLMDAINEARI